MVLSRPTHPVFEVPGFLAPKSINDVKELAKMIALGEWAPESYRDIDGNFRQQQIELAIMHGASVGLGPFAAVQSIAVINGMPSIWGDGALSVIEHSGLLEDMVEDYALDGEQGLVAICTMKRRHRATAIVTRFSMGMADRAGLTRTEGPWQSYPERMLRMRARSWTMRDAFADVLRGLHIREEVEDYVGSTAISSRSPDRTPSATFPGSRGSRPTQPRFAAPTGRNFAVKPTERTAVSTAHPTTGDDEVRTTGHHEDSVAPQSLATKLETLPPTGGMATGPDSSRQPDPSAPCKTFTIANAEGEFIDVSGVEALRSAFERLFFDPHLPPGQVVGLWEANEDARSVITQAFGLAALVEAEAHLRTATQRYKEERAERRSATRRSPANELDAVGDGAPATGSAPQAWRPTGDATA
jgi:hypothetical protein